MNRLISILSVVIVMAPAVYGQGLFGARSRPVRHDDRNTVVRRCRHRDEPCRATVLVHLILNSR